MCEARQQGGEEAAGGGGLEGLSALRLLFLSTWPPMPNSSPLPGPTLVCTIGKGADCPRKDIMDCSPQMGESSPTSCKKQLSSQLPSSCRGGAWALGLWPAAPCWGMVGRQGRGTAVNPGKEFSKDNASGELLCLSYILS